MDTSKEYFIGREREIERFKELLNDTTSSRKKIIFIYDAEVDPDKKGGIGKTWLLRKFRSIVDSEQYQKKFIVIPEIFDFFEPDIQNRLSRHMKIVEGIEKKADSDDFKTFWRLVENYFMGSGSIENVLEAFFDGYNAVGKKTGKTIIRFYDTYERVENTLNYYKAPYRFISDRIIHDSIVVISGRFPPNYLTPVWQDRKNVIEDMPLHGFSLDETRRYFEKRDITNITDLDLMTINQKAVGRPILLALTVDLLTGPGKPINLASLSKLPDKHFKEKLVSFIREFRRPTDVAILALTHLKHRCDKRILADYLSTYYEDEVKDFEKMFKTLSEFSFVRPISHDGTVIVLHDEMQRMISEYVFPNVDAGHKIRKDLSKLVQNYYDEEIAAREKTIQKKSESNKAQAQVLKSEVASLLSEKWYHRLFYDHTKETFDLYFFSLFDPKLDDGELDYLLMLLSHLEELDHHLNFNELINNKIKLRKARVYNGKLQQTGDLYYFNEANNILTYLLKNAEKSPESPPRYLANLLLEIGILNFYNGKLVLAQKALEDSVKELNKELKSKGEKNIDLDLAYFIGKSYNWLGYILYQQGYFKQSIEKLTSAEKKLDEANILISKTIISSELKEFRQRQIYHWLAQVQGNLCRIYREIGDIDTAVDYGESSRYIREQVNKPLEIVKAYNSLGLAYFRQNRIVEAKELFNNAENILKNYPDTVLEARIRTNQATLLFKRDQYSELFDFYLLKEFELRKDALGIKDHNFNDAKQLLTSVIREILPLGIRELATAYYNLGELLLILKDWDESERNFNHALKVAKDRNDAYTLINALQRLVLLSYFKQDENMIIQYSNQFLNELNNINNREETAKYVIRFYLTMGNHNYEKLLDIITDRSKGEEALKAIKNSFQYYSDACIYAKLHYERSYRKIIQIYTKRFSPLINSNVELIDKSFNYLKECWLNSKLSLLDFEKITSGYFLYKKIH